MKNKITKILALVVALVVIATGFASVDASAAAKITASKKTQTLVVGQKFTLAAKQSGKTLAKSKVKFATSNKKVATVATSGVVTAKKAGTATITVSLKSNKNVKATCKVTVKKSATKLVASKSKVELVAGASVASMKAATVTVKANGLSYTAVKFSSSDAKVASVSTKGAITAKKAGTAKITITDKKNSKVKATVSVTVKDAPTSVKATATKTSLTVGEKTTVKATVNKGAVATVKFTSSNTKVATVDSKGVVTAKSVGTATITATSTVNTKKVGSVKITVVKKAEPTTKPTEKPTTKPTEEPTTEPIPPTNLRSETDEAVVYTFDLSRKTATLVIPRGSNVNVTVKNTDVAEFVDSVADCFALLKDGDSVKDNFSNSSEKFNKKVEEVFNSGLSKSLQAASSEFVLQLPNTENDLKCIYNTTGKWFNFGFAWDQLAYKSYKKFTKGDKEINYEVWAKEPAISVKDGVTRLYSDKAYCSGLGKEVKFEVSYSYDKNANADTLKLRIDEKEILTVVKTDANVTLTVSKANYNVFKSVFAPETNLLGITGTNN